MDDPAADVDLGDELLKDEDRAVSKPELLWDETGLGGIRDRPKLMRQKYVSICYVFNVSDW